MASLTISNYLAMLQDNPYDEESFDGIKEVLAGGDADRIGENPLRLMEAARARHERHGEIYAVARLITVEAALCEDDPSFRVALLKELGRIRREELLDDEGALEALNEAIEVGGADDDIAATIEEIQQTADKWRPIADRFIEEADDGSDPSLKASMLAKAGTLVWQYQKKGRAKEVDRLFKQALKADPASTRAARLYCHVLRQRKKFKDMAAVLNRTADAARNRDEKLHLYLAAARAFSRDADNADRACTCYERVLDFTPVHEEALRFLVEYFTGREDWDRLVSLYEDALRSRQKIESEQGILLQIAMVHWRIRESSSDAEPYFARLRKIDPAHEGMLNFYREHLSKLSEEGGEAREEAQGRLLTILGDAQRVAGDDETKLALSIEHAQAAQRSGATERAIDAWKAVQRIDAANEEAGNALRQLYRDGEKWNALVEVMRAELDALPKNSDDEQIKGRRVELLRELVEIYRDRLKLDVMVTSTYAALLAEDPLDTSAMQELADTYASMGRWNDLIPVLVRQTEIVDDPVFKVDLLMRTARLWIDRFANYNKATEPLEAIIEIEPEHREALGLLKTIYTKKRAWKSLYAVLGKESQLASDPSARLEMKIELAKLAGDRLHQHADAITLWRDVVEESPDTPGAIDALIKLSEREKDWGTLAYALELAQARQEDEKKRIKLLQRLGSTYGDHLDDPAEASGAWKRVLELDPKNGKALRTLREAFVSACDWDGLDALYAESGDWEGLVDVLGNAAERTDDEGLKKELSFRAAYVYEERLENPGRAFRSYERVLSVDPSNEQAARKLVPIYESQEKWPRLLALKEVLLTTLAEDDREGRLEALASLQSLATTKTRDENSAFRFAAAAYEIAPESGEVRERLESAAASSGNFAQLAQIYEARVASEDLPESDRRVLRRRLAALAGGELGNREDAIQQLQRILEGEPTDAETIESLDTLYRQEARTEDLRRLYDHRLEHATDDAERYALLSELAPLEEDVVGDEESAASRYRAMVELDPTDAMALSALDRLAVGGERWAELGSVLERRSELSDQSSEARTALVLRLADLRRERLGDMVGAHAAYASVLENDQSSAHAISGLEALLQVDEVKADAARLLEQAYDASGQHEKLLGALRARLETTEDIEERRSLRLRLAECAGALGDVEGAYEALEAAFLDRPSDAELWDRLAAAAEATGNHERLAVAFSTAIEAGDLNDADVSELSTRVATVYDVILGRPEDAEPHHRRVLHADPNHVGAFASLKELYTERERWEDLQALYRNRIAETMDTEMRLELLLQVCFLFEEILDDPEQAIRSYQEVIELEPEHIPSIRALDRLFRRTNRHRDLAALLRREQDRTTEEPQLIALIFEVGELHEKKLEEPGVAVDEYERVLEINPTHINAQQALERLLASPSQRQRIAVLLEPLYESQGAWNELGTVLRVQLENVSDQGGRLSLLLRIAELSENRLHDPQQAFDVLADAVLCDPADGEARREFARLSVICDNTAKRAEVLKQAAETLEGAGYTQAEVLAELGAAYDELGDSGNATVAYQKLIEVDGDNPDSVVPAAKALERIFLSSGDQSALAETYRLQVRFGEDEAERALMLARLGELLEQQGDDAGAIAAHRQRLDIDPGEVDALAALERLYTTKKDWQRLIGVLQAREATADDPAEQRRFALQIGRVYQDDLEDIDNAVIAYNEVLSRFGRDGETLDSLASLYEKGERWYDLLEVREMQTEQAEDPTEAAARRFEMAELMRVHTGDAERSVGEYADVLRVLPNHEGSVAALLAMATGDDQNVTVDAARVLVPHYESSGDHGRLITALEVVSGSDDPAERLQSLQRAAEVAELGHDNPGQAFEFLARALRGAAGEDGFERMVDDAERLSASADQHEAYVALLEQVAPDIFDGEMQTRVYLRAAAVADSRLGDRARARTLYQKVLENRPEDGAALDALDQLQVADGDYAALVQTLRRKIELANESAERIGLLERLAGIYEEHLDDVPAAIDVMEEVLGEDEQRLAAYETSERLLSGTERHDDLAQHYERWLDAGVGNAVELRHRLAVLATQKLDDPYRGLEQWREALAMDGSHEPSINAVEALLVREELRNSAAELLEPVFLARGEWPRVVAALRARLSVTDDREGRKQIHQQLGQIHEDYLEDLDGAFKAYAALFAEEPTDRASWDTLGRLGRVLEQWGPLADVYQGAVADQGVQDEETLTLAKMAARLYDERTSNLDAAAILYAQALEFEPRDKESFEGLRSIYSRTGRTEELATLLRNGADVSETDDDRLELLHELAALYSSRTSQASDTDSETDSDSETETDSEVAPETTEANRENLDRAIDTYREAVELRPQDSRAVLALDALLLQTERWQDLADHVRFQAEMADGVARADLEYRVGMLLHEKLDDTRGAIDVFEETLGRERSHGPTIEALEGLVVLEEHQTRITEVLEPIYRDADQWRKLVAVLEARASTADASDAASILGEIGRLHEERGDDVGLAFAAWSRAFAADPQGPAQAEVDRLAAQNGGWDQQVAAYEAAIAASDDVDLKSRLMMSMAQTHDTKRGDPRAAILTYEKLSALDESNQAALDSLEGLHTMVGDWAGLVDVYRRKVEQRFDPIERAELLRRSASVQEELLADVDGAITTYIRATEEDPDDAIALESLDRLYSAASRFDDLAAVLRRRLIVETDDEILVDVGVRLGQLAETQLNLPNEAIDAFTEVLAVSHAHPEAIDSLGRLYERQALWPEFLENLQLRASIAETSSDRVALVQRTGEVYERELDDVHEAIAQYQQALELDTRYAPALDALIRISKLEDYREQTAEILEPLLHVQERWADLADLFRLKAEVGHNPQDRKADFLRLAEVEENGRRDKEAAFEAVASAFGEDPADEHCADQLERLALEINAYPRALEEFKGRASAAHDPTVARDLYLRVARIAEGQLNDRPKAIDAFGHALEQVGDQPELLENLDRLYGAEEDWSNLGGTIERRVGVAVDPTERASLLVRLGELRETRFEDLRGAFSAYQEVIERDPGDSRATDALERLGKAPELALDVVDVLEHAYRETGAIDRVVGLYDIRVGLAETEGERVRMLQEAAQLWENELGRPEKAFESLKAAAELDPSDDQMLDDVERLAGATGAWESLRGFVESVEAKGDAEGRVLRDLNVRAAGWYLDRMGDPAAAEERLRKVLADGDESLEVHERLVELLRAPGREAELVVALRAHAAANTDDFERKERLWEAARLAESALADQGVAGECLELVLELDPSDRQALAELSRIRQAQERWEDVARLIERQIDVEADPAIRVSLRRQQSALYAGPLESPERATAAWEALLDEEPTDIEAIGALETLYDGAERWDDLRALLDRRLDIATSDAERISARVRLARLAERAFGQRGDALEQLRGVLEIDPNNSEALDELERLLTLEEDWDALVALLDERSVTASQAMPYGEEEWLVQRAILMRLAELHEHQRDDLEAALIVYGGVLETEPEHLPSLTRQAAIYESAGEYGDAASALERLAPLLERGPQAQTYQRIAAMAEENLHDSDRALAALVRAYEVLPSATGRELLRTHYEQREDWAQCAELMGAEANEETDPKEKVEIYKRIAELYSDKLGDPASAATYLERASELVPEDRAILLPLCDLYIAAGRQSDAAVVLRQIIESFGGRRSKELAQYHHRLGKALEGMGDTEGAMTHYDAAFRIDLTNVSILRDLGKLTYGLGDMARAQKTFRALLLQKLDPAAGISKADVYFYLGSIANQEGNTRKAISMLERSVSEDREHAEAVALLATLK